MGLAVGSIDYLATGSTKWRAWSLAAWFILGVVGEVLAGQPAYALVKAVWGMVCFGRWEQQQST